MFPQLQADGWNLKHDVSVAFEKYIDTTLNVCSDTISYTSSKQKVSSDGAYFAL